MQKNTGEDPEIWGMVGLLHDFDWEIHPTLAEHPQAGASILRERAFQSRSFEPYSVTLTIPVYHARRKWKKRCMPVMKLLA